MSGDFRLWLIFLGLGLPVMVVLGLLVIQGRKFTLWQSPVLVSSLLMYVLLAIANLEHPFFCLVFLSFAGFQMASLAYLRRANGDAELDPPAKPVPPSDASNTEPG